MFCRYCGEKNKADAKFCAENHNCSTLEAENTIIKGN
jgi:hypothetical protein